MSPLLFKQNVFSRFSYLVTYARDEEHHGGDLENCLRIFEVATGEEKRSFSPSQGSVRVHDWPFFKWSYNEKYFAFCRPKGNAINVYDTETFTLCDNKAIDVGKRSMILFRNYAHTFADRLVTFEWNPAKNLIAYYAEEMVGAFRNYINHN